MRDLCETCARLVRDLCETCLPLVDERQRGIHYSERLREGQPAHLSYLWCDGGLGGRGHLPPRLARLQPLVVLPAPTERVIHSFRCELQRQVIVCNICDEDVLFIALALELEGDGGEEDGLELRRAAPSANPTAAPIATEAAEGVEAHEELLA